MLLTPQQRDGILSEDEVSVVAKATLDFLHGNLAGSSSRFTLPSVERIVRYLAVAKEFGAAREKANRSLAEMAKSLRVPQYKLRAIEGGGSTGIDPVLFRRYAQALGLSQWVSRWIAANRALAGQLGLISGQGAKGGPTTR